MTRQLAEVQGLLAQDLSVLRYLDRTRAEQPMREAIQADISNLEVPVPAEPPQPTGPRGEPDTGMTAPPTRQVTPEEPIPETAEQPQETGDDINLEDLMGEPEAVPEEDVHEVKVLKNKSTWKGKKGKELELKYLDEHEWKKFTEADNKQWETHFKNDAVTVIMPKEADKIPASKICKAPAR